ncbi:MAG: YbhB/YbcL family Raf kinase inhibitor-like protein [Pyrinomonadaceae bacterium]
MNIKLRLIIPLMLLVLTGCESRSKTSLDNSAANSTPSPIAGSIKLVSAGFTDGQPLPRQYTCSGVNVSPPLEWTGVPKSAKTVAIIADDPDAPSGTWGHWVVYNLPAETIGMVENLPATDDLKGGGFQGRNDFGNVGYGGPCPPSGTHRYFFKIYALDNELTLKPGATKAELEKAMESHVVGQGQLMGTYRK